MTVQDLDFQTVHDPAFVVNRPAGFQAYLVMCFTTPFFSRTRDGVMQGLPGDCIIHDLKFPQWHGTPAGQKTGFRNDWLHVAGEGREFPELVRRYGLAFNQIIRTGRPDLIGGPLHAIARERLRQERYWQRAVAQQIEAMLLAMARGQEHGGDEPAARLALRERFVELREEVARKLAQRWTVPEMALRVGLSASRFSVLYHEFFGSTPMEDLIGRRIDLGKQMLSQTDLKVMEVAERCGFASVYYFSRAFRKRVGCPPGRYR